MKNLFKYVFISLLLLSQSIVAQDIEFIFDYYGVEDGLSQSEVICIFQDSRGLIWIGTQAGLNRFDGRNFISYDKDPLDSNSISSGWVYSIAEDFNGNLWIGTQNGLNKFDPVTEKFEHYLTSPQEIKELGSNTVYSILVENKDLIWIKTDYTISKFIPSENRFIHYSHKSDEDLFTVPKTDFHLPMLETKTGIWTGSSFGLQFFSFEYDQIQSFHHEKGNPLTIPDDYVNALAMDNSGNIFVGTENGIAYFETFRNIVRPLLTSEINKILEDAGSKHVTGLLIDQSNDGRVLIISTYGGGIVTYDLINKTSRIFKEDKANPQSLKYNRINTLFRDKSRNLWVGLNGRGINKYSPKGTKFKTYKNAGNSGIKLSDNLVASIYANKEEIWVGTWSLGLNIINKKTKEITYINTKGPENQRISDDHVHCLFKRSNGNIWIGTKNGIDIYKTSSENFYSFEKYFGVELPDNLKESRINVIREIDNEKVLIGSAKGLTFFDTFTKTFSFLKSDLEENNIKSTVYDIWIDPDFYWVATLDGLYKIDKNQNVIKVYKTSENLTEISDGLYKELNSSGIFDITKDKYGYFWLATESGLNKFDPKKETFSYYTMLTKGLQDNTIYELLLKNNDNLWLSSNRGISMLNVTTDSIKSYTTSDGLQGLEFNNGASFVSETGEFYFGGFDGFNVFFPDSIKENTTVPNAIFENYSIINNKGETHTHSLFGVQKIKMSYNDNSIKIFFASLEYTNPSKNQYKYKLEGQDDNWIPLDEQNYVSFPSLRPGEYVLKVKGSNNDLIWSDEIALEISVSYPLYDNIWAYLVYFLILGLIIYRIWQQNRNKQRRANEEIRNKQLMNLKLEQQKEELDIQNTNMTDSINYAKHIQEAMLPSDFLFKKLIPNSFVLYITKDIVSGDFYWIAQRGTKTFIAAVDCTGHGVPGAFMSIIGFDLLKNIVRERGVEDPAEILNQLNYGVSDTFRNTNSDDQKIRDGMDITLCVIDKSKHTIEFSGAMNPLCMIREDSISLIKGNRFSIGSLNDDENNKFDKHTIKYKQGDSFYLFSDGYFDQFGGALGKKFKQKRFLHLLLNIHHLSPEKQRNELKENFNRWKDQLEQVDDVLVIGFKL